MSPRLACRAGIQAGRAYHRSREPPNFSYASPYKGLSSCRGDPSDESAQEVVACPAFPRNLPELWPDLRPGLRRRSGADRGGRSLGRGGLAAVPRPAAERGLRGERTAPELAGERPEGPLEEADRKRVLHRGRGRRRSLHHGRGGGERDGLPPARGGRRGGLARPRRTG